MYKVYILSIVKIEKKNFHKYHFLSFLRIFNKSKIFYILNCIYIKFKKLFK